MYVFISLLVGFFAIGLTNMFGVGGGGVATPALRIFLGVTPAIALGTTLPVAIPAAVAGAYTYYRHGYVSVTSAFYCCLGGLVGSVGGALLTRVVNLNYIMIATGAVVLYLAAIVERRGITGREMKSRAPGPPGGGGAEPGPERDSRRRLFLAVGIGLAAGLLSGLLGVGGGIVLIPSFLYLLEFPLKKAFGTSLAVVAVIAVPGTIVHAFLGHISWMLALYLVLGSIPGAYLGARISIEAHERLLYVLFGAVLFAFGTLFIVKEVLQLVA